jgi:hypothetical protein
MKSQANGIHNTWTNLGMLKCKKVNLERKKTVVRATTVANLDLLESIKNIETETSFKPLRPHMINDQDPIVKSCVISARPRAHTALENFPGSMLKSKHILPKARQAGDFKLKLKKSASQGVTSPSTFINGTQDPKKPSEPTLQLPIKLARHKNKDPDKHLARSAELVREDTPTSRSKFSDNNSVIRDKSVSAVTNKKGSMASPQPSLGKSRRSLLTPTSPQFRPAMMNRESLSESLVSGNSSKI